MHKGSPVETEMGSVCGGGCVTEAGCGKKGCKTSGRTGALGGGVKKGRGAGPGSNEGVWVGSCSF